MRILLTANASYFPPRGGATRSNLVWMDHLAAAGHACRIVASTLPHSAARREQLLQERIQAEVAQLDAGVEVAQRGAIHVWSVDEPARRVQVLRQQIAHFRPDWVLVSSEDLGHSLLREAHHGAPGRVVYLAHTPQFFPFGRASWYPDPHGAELVAAAAGVVAIGHRMARDIEGYLRRPVAVIHPPIYGQGPFANYANFESGLITMINPCAVKGISIFLELAARFPPHEFAVVPGWGTTAGDLNALERLRNVRILPNCKHIDEVLSRTRILLMPSLWYEGFGLIVMESMLRGIPVIASDSGGLLEAKEGTGYVLPANKIERYEPMFDEHGMPKAVIVRTDVEPWAAALQELLSDRAAYQRESELSREAAARFVSGLDAGAMDRFLLSLDSRAAIPSAPEHHNMESLTPERRALLLQRLRKRKVEAR